MYIQHTTDIFSHNDIFVVPRLNVTVQRYSPPYETHGLAVILSKPAKYVAPYATRDIDNDSLPIGFSSRFVRFVRN